MHRMRQFRARHRASYATESGSTLASDDGRGSRAPTHQKVGRMNLARNNHPWMDKSPQLTCQLSSQLSSWYLFFSGVCPLAVEDELCWCLDGGRGEKIAEIGMEVCEAFRMRALLLPAPRVDGGPDSDLTDVGRPPRIGVEGNRCGLDSFDSERRIFLRGKADGTVQPHQGDDSRQLNHALTISQTATSTFVVGLRIVLRLTLPSNSVGHMLIELRRNMECAQLCCR